MNTGLLLAEKRNDAARMLKRKHAELVKLVGGAEPTMYESLEQSLVDQQKAWLVYMPSECWLLGAGLKGGGGSWPSTHAVSCEANLMYRRYRTVTHAVDCIKRIPADHRAADMGACLYQLSELTIGR